ncbi:alpha/beta hydrolase [Pedobacter sp. BS3]|nr:alpha/beta hydrolase [Pedobacter sp. BS3]
MIKNISVKITLFSMLYMPLLLFAQSDVDKRKAYLKDILTINVSKDHRVSISRRVTLKDSTWLEWLHRSGELPPDFSKMPSIPMLPDPLVLNQNGRNQPVQTLQQWEAKRQWIKEQFQYWISGKIPPPPKDFKVTVLSDGYEERTHIQLITLHFGPGYKAKMTFELMLPEEKGPLPVYMTQWTHRDWAQLAVRRGYIGCVYAGADSKDDTQAYQALYPDYDFTCLMRRAWGASRVIDYLVTRKEVNKNQIAITGHSRNGKQSLWAAAFDDRIAAVVSSSSGTGGVTPWRYSDPQYCDQTLDDICANAAHWFHPRLRFFFGREDKLPIDQNLLLSLIAPRILLLHYSIVERQLNPWSTEQNYQSVKKVYSFLGVPDNIGVLSRMGEHAVAARDVERSIDFLDIKFNRKQFPWENVLYYNYSFTVWENEHTADKLASQKITPVHLKESYPDTTIFAAHKKQFLNNLQWLLGNEPPGIKPGEIAPTIPARVDWIDGIIGRPKIAGAKAVYIGPYTAIGDHISGMLYYPVDKSGNKKVQANGKIPVVIFLHQYAYAHGYAYGYDKDSGNGNSKLFQELVNHGFAVMAIDMFGFGTRNQEAPYFYQRYPEWSKMGKMVSDVRACVDALETFNDIDRRHIFLLGNTIGGSVGLMAAAQDNRIAGLAVVAAFSPWRTSNGRYESIRTYSHLHGFIPRLGFYAGDPQQVPVDFPEIISCIAPRPLLIISPVLDRYTDMEAVRKVMPSVKSVYKLYQQPEQLQFDTPREINRMTVPMYSQVATFYSNLINQEP